MLSQVAALQRLPPAGGDGPLILHPQPRAAHGTQAHSVQGMQLRWIIPKLGMVPLLDLQQSGHSAVGEVGWGQGSQELRPGDPGGCRLEATALGLSAVGADVSLLV